MSFQAYIDNIKAETGEIVAWLNEIFELGHGHAMSICAAFKGKTK